MRDYHISKDAEIKLHEMMLNHEIRMAIQSADRSFLTSFLGKAWMNPRGKENDGSR